MPRICVGTCKKYNEGNLFGKWIDMEEMSDKDTFYENCQEMHADEDDPEFMFQDWEGIPDTFITECSISVEFWDYMNCELDEDVKEAFISCFGTWNADKCEECYIGKYDTPADFAYDVVEDRGILSDVPNELARYFDYEGFGTDLMYDAFESSGHYFWNW